MTKSTPEWIKEKNRQLRAGKACAKCGKKPVEFHHIKPTALSGSGRGRIERYYDIKKNPECYQPLCHGCHIGVHSSDAS